MKDTEPPKQSNEPEPRPKPDPTTAQNTSSTLRIVVEAALIPLGIVLPPKPERLTRYVDNL